MAEVLDNIVSNAIKYSPQGRKVNLKLEEKNASYWISVSDQGPGILPEDRDKLFQKFQKLSAKPTGGESSTGLGLSIVKALADQLGAKIDVESEVGKGSTFAVKLPMG